MPGAPSSVLEDAKKQLPLLPLALPFLLVAMRLLLAATSSF